MDSLGLAGRIIGIVSFSIQIANDLRSVSFDVGGLSDLELLPLSRTKSLFAQLVELLSTLQGTSTVSPGLLSDNFAKFEEELKNLRSILATLKADVGRSRLKKSLTVYQSRHRIASISARLTELNNTLDLLLQLVFTLLEKCLSKTLIIATRVARVQESNRVRQEEYQQSAEQAKEQSLLIAPYINRLSKRQKQFLGKIKFSLGKNYYIHLQHPIAETPGSTDDSIQHHDRIALDSVPFREVLDEEIEPLTSSAHDKDHLQLLSVLTPLESA